jgi:hypothetical protein
MLICHLKRHLSIIIEYFQFFYEFYLDETQLQTRWSPKYVVIVMHLMANPSRSSRSYRNDTMLWFPLSMKKWGILIVLLTYYKSAIKFHNYLPSSLLNLDIRHFGVLSHEAVHLFEVPTDGDFEPWPSNLGLFELCNIGHRREMNMHHQNNQTHHCKQSTYTSSVSSGPDVDVTFQDMSQEMEEWFNLLAQQHHQAREGDRHWLVRLLTCGCLLGWLVLNSRWPPRSGLAMPT